MLVEAAEPVAVPAVARQAPDSRLGFRGASAGFTRFAPLCAAGALRQVLEHLLTVRELPRGELSRRRDLERQRTLRPGLATRTRPFGPRPKALKTNGVTGADVAARLPPG